MPFVKFTSSVPSLISLLLGSVLSESPVCSLHYTHINLHCAASALAPGEECVLGAVVYVSCPQLVFLLVVSDCLS